MESYSQGRICDHYNVMDRDPNYSLIGRRFDYHVPLFMMQPYQTLLIKAPIQRGSTKEEDLKFKTHCSNSDVEH
jgi:hypothetical protein